MRHQFTLIGWAVRLHLLRWSRYRVDVVLWILMIWTTLAIQGFFIFTIYNSTAGNLFGYSAEQLTSFFAIAILSTGLAQSVGHGVFLHLAPAVWTGHFDYWLLHPTSLFIRILVEEVGVIWFWPHIIVGTVLLLVSTSVSAWPLAILTVILCSILELGLIFIVCIPAIHWGRWDPNEGAWEYLENARSIPVTRINNTLLWIASFGVLHYSIALSVMTGEYPFWVLLFCTFFTALFGFGLLTYIVRYYGSASS